MTRLGFSFNLRVVFTKNNIVVYTDQFLMHLLLFSLYEGSVLSIELGRI